MVFEYSMYYRQNCIVPIILAAISVVLLVINIASIIKMERPLILKKCVFQIVAVCLYVYLIIINLTPLLRGGVHLLYEKEENKTQISGMVEETGEVDFITGAKYGVEQNRGSGESITIQGIKYYLVTYGDLKIGDSVTAEVLPKSKFVLSITKNKD